jgi:hypothetical protein
MLDAGGPQPASLRCAPGPSCSDASCCCCMLPMQWACMRHLRDASVNFACLTICAVRTNACAAALLPICGGACAETAFRNVLLCECRLLG